jgi:metal-responsive CopG/Arc/MetJ family transcriptional regulator
MAKVLISMPDDLLEDVDRAAARAGTSRSAYLQGAARSALATPSRERIRAALERGRVAMRDIPSFESADLIRRDRDTHAIDHTTRRRS